MNKKQTKSKQRVQKFGEVNTSKREIDNILNLFEFESERIDSRILEPACGDGNFLSEVLERKLLNLKKLYKNMQYEFEKNSVIVVGSIYGIEILEDNTQHTRNLLFKKYEDFYNSLFKTPNKDLLESIKSIIQKNIIHGDALSLVDLKTKKSIIFSEWSLINNKIKRRDFTFENLLDSSFDSRGTLFEQIEGDVFIPEPIKDFGLVDYDKVNKIC